MECEESLKTHTKMHHEINDEAIERLWNMGEAMWNQDVKEVKRQLPTVTSMISDLVVPADRESAKRDLMATLRLLSVMDEKTMAIALGKMK